MRQWIILSGLALATTIANAALVSGNTANGCTYQVINGEYRYNCEPKAPKILAAPAGVVEETASNTATPVVTTQEPQIMEVTPLPPQNQNEQVTGEVHNQPKQYSSIQSDTAEPAPTAVADRLYTGAQIGNNVVTKAQSGATGLSLNLGTDLDQSWGLEVDYSYANQDLLLGLANRQGQGTLGNTSRLINDSNLLTHVISAEGQYHLTPVSFRLRPFAGVGLGWRFASLEEDLPYANTNYQNSNYSVAKNAKLKQSSFVQVTSFGLKLKVSDNVQLAGVFRYFLPLSRQQAFISSDSSRLNLGDSDYTGSSQYQLNAGLQVFF